jgi:2-C-methyl-D-erythritol 2,4-cyclodiphosphate synthase
MLYRIGHGYDVHRLSSDRDLILGGVAVPHEKGLLGHSDADVLVHAVMDAVLGALALGDIGRHFPDTDPKYKGISSIALAKQVAELMMQSGYRIGNVDVTVIAQRPKLAPFVPQMQKNVAEAFGAPLSAVNIKATTEEHLGFTGREEGIAAHAVCICVSDGE